MMYQVDMTLTSSEGKVKKLTGTLSDISDPIPPTPSGVDFSGNFRMFPPGHIIQSTSEWKEIFHEGVEQGVGIYCLEDNTDATRHDFRIEEDGVISAFMPKGSYGMGHRSVQLKLGKVSGPVNHSFEWMCPDPGTNLWVNGGGKWGPAIQYGPIQSGSTGGIRFMLTWAAGASTLGKQDLTCSIQNQPDGGQWLQPPYYGLRPIEYGHWYKIRIRMEGGRSSAPNTVHCQYWKDDDPVMDYTAETTNSNAQEDKADVFIDWTCFFGGGEANCAPKDCRFHFRNFRTWVE